MQFKALVMPESAVVSATPQKRLPGNSWQVLAGDPDRRFWTQTLRIMRIISVLLLVACLHTYAEGYSQTITFKGRDVSLQKIFTVIKKQTGYTVMYNADHLGKARPVSVDVVNLSVESFLQKILTNQPFEYSIENTTIFIARKEQSPAVAKTAPVLPDSAAAASPATDITGRVVNERGEPLANASVFLKGSGRGTLTDAKGQFTLKDVDENDILVVTFIGYNEILVPLKGKKDVQLTMKVATSELDKTVVIAYGTTSRRMATGNVGKISAEEIEKQPVMNPLLALGGRIAGLDVNSTSGYASGTVKVEIRGRSTINPFFTSDPLYIIDGVPLTIMELTSNSSTYQNGSSGVLQNGLPAPAGGQSPFFSLNPADIESMEVLKDADATAIYGSRGANGVIIITTKRGKNGKTKFNLNVNQGMSAVTRHWDMLNTAQYLKMRREAFQNDGIIPDISNAPDLFLYDTTVNRNWQKELWGNTGKMTDVSAGLSGGDGRTTFRLNASYRRQTEILTQSGSSNRASVSFNLNHRSRNERLSLSLSTFYSFAKENSISVSSATTLPPNAPAIFDSLGALNYGPWNAAGIGDYFPFGSLLQPYESKTNFLTSNLTASYEIIKGLSFSTSVGYNNMSALQSRLQTIASQNPLYMPFGIGYFGNNRNSNWIIEPQLNYTGFIGDGKLNILAGASSQSTITNGLASVGIGYSNDAFIRSIANAPMQLSLENYGEYKYAALFARINYNWRNKWILNLNARRDGSSRFGPGKQFGNFGSAGAAWILSEESWVRKVLPTFIGFLKLRSSYGITGSDQVGDYQYLSQWGAGPGSSSLFTYNGISPLISQHAVNQNYHWERNKKFEAAINIGLMKDNRINLEAVYYRNRCDNQLTQIPTPVYTGFPNVTANWPALVQNSGWEFVASGNIFYNKNFSWATSFNISFNKNRLLEYPGFEQSPYYTTFKVGQSVNTMYLLHYEGVDPQTGEYVFTDQNKDGMTVTNSSVVPGTGNDDRITAVDLAPRFMGGWTNTFGYKNWKLSFSFYFKKQKGVNALFGSNYPGSMDNMPAEVYDNHWQNPGEVAKYAKLSTQSQIGWIYFKQSDGIYTDASFLRLSNLSVSYDLPVSFIGKAGMERCSIYVNAQNVFVLTGYKGIDPEVQTFGVLPPAKIISAGLSFNF